MSRTKQFLEFVAAQAGMSVGQYLHELDKQRKMDKEWEEWEFHRSVNTGEYFDADYEGVTNDIRKQREQARRS